MRPHFGLGAQPLDGAVEHLDHQLGRDGRVLDLTHRDQVDPRFLDLDDRTTGVGELVVFLVERVGWGFAITMSGEIGKSILP